MSTPPRLVELNDGRMVDTNGREWLAECMHRAEQLQQLWGMPRVNRGTYIESIGRLEGARAADRLRERFKLEFDERLHEQDGP